MLTRSIQDDATPALQEDSTLHLHAFAALHCHFCSLAACMGVMWLLCGKMSNQLVHLRMERFLREGMQALEE